MVLPENQPNPILHIIRKEVKLCMVELRIEERNLGIPCVVLAALGIIASHRQFERANDPDGDQSDSPRASGSDENIETSTMRCL